MRNLFLVLVFANVVYFLWSRYVHQPVVDSGILVHDERNLRPIVDLASRASDPISESVPTDPATVPDEPAAAEPAVAICISIGPNSDEKAAEDLLAQVRAAGIDGVVRAAPGDVFIGHWVQASDFENRAATNAALEKLKAAGMTEAYIVGDPTDGFGISIGLFSELPRAERVELQAKSIGVNATVVDRTRPGTVYWVDTRTTAPDLLAMVAGDRPSVSGPAATCP